MFLSSFASLVERGLQELPPQHHRLSDVVGPNRVADGGVLELGEDHSCFCLAGAIFSKLPLVEEFGKIRFIAIQGRHQLASQLFLADGCLSSEGPLEASEAFVELGVVDRAGSTCQGQYWILVGHC